MVTIYKYVLYPSDKCSEPISHTLMGCPTDDTKELWTFNEKQNKCEPMQVDKCNGYSGNVFERETDCKTLCVSN